MVSGAHLQLDDGLRPRRQVQRVRLALDLQPLAERERFHPRVVRQAVRIDGFHTVGRCESRDEEVRHAIGKSTGVLVTDERGWGRREPLYNNQPPMLLTRLCGVFVRLNRIRGQGSGSARHPCRIQPAKERYTVNRVRRRRPRTETVTPVGIPASEPLKSGFRPALRVSADRSQPVCKTPSIKMGGKRMGL